jgi:hypothetical protein
VDLRKGEEIAVAVGHCRLHCIPGNSQAKTFSVTLAAYTSLALAQSKEDPSITPLIELQSGPLTPGFMLDESPRPIHQIRLLVDASLGRGILILDGNQPEFNEFGELVGGIHTPHVRAKGNAALILKYECSIELVKEGPKKWRLNQQRSEVAHRPSYRDKRLHCRRWTSSLGHPS